MPPEHTTGKLALLAEDWFRQNHRQHHLTLQRLTQNWAQVVGEDLARRTRPTRLENGVLWVHTADGSWAYNLRFMGGQLLNGVRAWLQSLEVRDIRFKAGDISSDAAPSEPIPPALTPFCPDPEVAKTAEVIPDPAIREAFVRAFSKLKQARSSGTLPPSAP
ncbi:MAG: DUF721 domain-containing protein [Deltaproteobacteria bacterium]|nr:DUF721 domain-containing protein [Deltaproteobacteria bacterium]